MPEAPRGEDNRVWISTRVLRDLIQMRIQHPHSVEPLSDWEVVVHLAFDLCDGVERSEAEYALLWRWTKQEVGRRMEQLSMRAAAFDAAKISLNQLQ